MEQMIPLTEAKARLAELVRDCADHDVVLLRHGRPAAILIAPDRLEAMYEQLEDLADRVAGYESVHTPADMRIPHGKVLVELGLGQ